MVFNVNDRVFYTHTGEYGTITEVDCSYDKPIVAQIDGSEWDMCYYPDGKLCLSSDEPAIILVNGNEKEIDKYKIKIKIRDLKRSMYRIDEIIKANKEYPILLKYLESTKREFEKEINTQQELCNRIK